MTVKEMKELSLAGLAYENANHLMYKITRLLAESEKLGSMGADKEWLTAHRKDLMQQAATAKAVLVRSTAQREQLRKIISSAPDEQLRQILEMRFCRQMAWERIAIRIGGGNTADGIRKRAVRYLATLK